MSTTNAGDGVGLVEAVRPSVADLVCRVHDNDIDGTHELLGSFTVLQMHAALVLLAANQTPDRPFKDRAGGRGVTFERIVEAVADYFCVDVVDIYNRGGEREVNDARHVVCWLRLAQGATSASVGRALGRDHSTVLHSSSRVTTTRRLRDIAETLMVELGIEPVLKTGRGKRDGQLL